MGWGVADIPPQEGRTAVVTGANSGLGRATAAGLAEAGARVVLAVRDVAKGEQAAADMPGTTEVRALDLADLASVHAFAEDLDGPVDLLINNAGVMATPLRRTADGFELQMGTNFLGHAALTGLLLPRITGRVVMLSSLGHWGGHVSLRDLNYEHRRYERWSAYAASKLADLMFAYELQRRLTVAASPVRAMAAHPGFAATELGTHTGIPLMGSVVGLGTRAFGHSGLDGALSTLYAATLPNLPGGSYIGPQGFGGISGAPGKARSSRAARDRTVASRLWALAESLTGVTIPV